DRFLTRPPGERGLVSRGAIVAAIGIGAAVVATLALGWWRAPPIPAPATPKAGPSAAAPAAVASAAPSVESREVASSAAPPGGLPPPPPAASAHAKRGAALPAPPASARPERPDPLADQL